MKYLLVCFVCLLVGNKPKILASPLKSISGESEVGIYGGKTTTIDNYPYLVAILENGSFLCAGTILSESWIITSAGCVKDADEVDTTIVAGSDDAVTGSIYDVTKIVNHDSYNSTTHDYDYALVKINGTFTWSNVTQKAQLPSEKLCSFSSVTVVGYGDQESNLTSSPSTKLREGTMKWWPKVFCESFYTTESVNLTDRMACAYNLAHTTLCDGDTADPFIVDGVIYGLYSYSASSYFGFCSAGAAPVILARTLPVTDWVGNVTGAAIDIA